MEDKSIVSPVGGGLLTMRLRSWTLAAPTARRTLRPDLGIAASVLNERVRQGLITPIFPTGDRRYSGYALAKLLGWPLSDDPRDYLPEQNLE